MSSDLDGEDYEILNILKEMLDGAKESESVIPKFKKRSEVMKDSTSGLTTVENRLCGYFCSETIFSLSHRVLTINEPELRCDFNEFCIGECAYVRHFRDEPQGFNETPAFTPNST